MTDTAACEHLMDKNYVYVDYSKVITEAQSHR